MLGDRVESMPTIEVYTQRGCNACEVEVPRIIREANALGIEVRQVDIDHCPVNRLDSCNRVEVVPTLMYQGREIGLSDLKQIAEGH